MISPKNSSIKDYTYHLPIDKIALYPLPERDCSKLLIYKNNNISIDICKNISAHLPLNSLLVFNNTKVINARIKFLKTTGSVIEIFCLEPFENLTDYSIIFNKKSSIQWKCMIGGASKWKDEYLEKIIIVHQTKTILRAKIIEKQSDAYVVEFDWMPSNICFGDIIEVAGSIPLPPYIKREVSASDTSTYQTIYAKDEGSVAAPTAGLHFSKTIFKTFESKNINTDFITLHVGAGTFKPVKAAQMADHEMHAEWINVSIPFIENLLSKLNEKIVAVGTTSARTLESIYWLGVKVIINPNIKILNLLQWEVYSLPLFNYNCTVKDSLFALLQWLKKNNKTQLFTSTQILISPSYSFKIVDILFTNFHQPQSTLLLLVAAAVGNEWKNIYDFALKNDFRFLSYGDANLIFLPNKNAQKQ